MSIGHISPEAAAGGNIGKIKDGDIIVIDIPSRSINVKLSDEELAARPQQPLKRNRLVSKALRAYAQSVSSADKGGVRIIELVFRESLKRQFLESLRKEKFLNYSE